MYCTAVRILLIGNSTQTFEKCAISLILISDDKIFRLLSLICWLNQSGIAYLSLKSIITKIPKCEYAVFHCLSCWLSITIIPLHLFPINFTGKGKCLFIFFLFCCGLPLSFQSNNSNAHIDSLNICLSCTPTYIQYCVHNHATIGTMRSRQMHAYMPCLRSHVPHTTCCPILSMRHTVMPHFVGASSCKHASMQTYVHISYI